MAAPDLAPPPVDTPLLEDSGKTGQVWTRWLQQLRDSVRGGGLSYAFCTTATAQALANGSTTLPINYSTVVADTDGAVTTGAGWKFTTPKGGLYAISAAASVATGGAAGEAIILLRKNGVEILRGPRCSATASSNVINLVMSAVLDLATGDVLDVGVYQSTGGARALEAAATSNWITISALRA